MGLPPYGPEPYASANSATPADAGFMIPQAPRVAQVDFSMALASFRRAGTMALSTGTQQLKRGHAVQPPTPQDQSWGASPSGAPRQPAAQEPTYTEPPLLLGRYRVVETRGTGGFGSVLVCWDIRLERRVAIKCMPIAQTPAGSESTLREALDEARITSRLTHPNIVTVHDFELAGGWAYLIMEYVDGLTLAELLGRVEGGALTYDECAHVLSCLANALAYAHENDVLHLDIKPSNVFIDTTGAVKLGDFGMASLASAAGWEGARGGTVGYMPPEQLTGGLVDERTDVFALAVVCYQALTGTSPFAAGDAAASLKRIERGAKPLAKVEAELKGPVSDGTARALAADASTRPASIGEFADSVLPYLGDEREGHASVADLMAQVTGECGPDERAWEEAAHVRAVERWPWLPGACVRAALGLACGLIGMRLMPQVAALFALGVADGTSSALGALGIGALGAAVPAVGIGAAEALMVLAVLAHGAYSPAFLVSMTTGVVCAVWWVSLHGNGPLAGTALLAPSALLAPTAGPGLAGVTLPPVRAAATSALGSLLFIVVKSSERAASGEELTLELAHALTSQQAWVMVGACTLAAWLCSLVGGRRGRGWKVAGQAIAALVLVAAQVNLIRVENGGIWNAGAAANVAVAVLCSVLLSIAIVTFGPAPKPREDERRELP